MQDIMLDLETLGNGPNSVILSIGGVKFGPNGLGEEFYRVVDAQSCIDSGLQMDVSTILWWMEQGDEARAEFKRKGANLGAALLDFRQFCGGGSDDLRVWGDGAAFDNAILANAYKKTNIERPWKFWNDRCYRTAKNLFPDVPFVRVGTGHNALDDAKSQAQHLISIGCVLR